MTLTQKTVPYTFESFRGLYTIQARKVLVPCHSVKIVVLTALTCILSTKLICMSYLCPPDSRALSSPAKSLTSEIQPFPSSSCEGKVTTDGIYLNINSARYHKALAIMCQVLETWGYMWVALQCACTAALLLVLDEICLLQESLSNISRLTPRDLGSAPSFTACCNLVNLQKRNI